MSIEPGAVRSGTQFFPYEMRHLPAQHIVYHKQHPRVFGKIEKNGHYMYISLFSKIDLISYFKVRNYIAYKIIIFCAAAKGISNASFYGYTCITGAKLHSQTGIESKCN